MGKTILKKVQLNQVMVQLQIHQKKAAKVIVLLQEIQAHQILLIVQVQVQVLQVLILARAVLILAIAVLILARAVVIVIRAAITAVVATVAVAVAAVKLNVLNE